MKIQYVADDGEVFDSEDECQTYERAAGAGAHPRFVQLVNDTLSPISCLDDRTNRVIYFDDDSDKTKVAIAITRSLDKLIECYNSIAKDRLLPTKSKKAKK